MKYYVVLRGYKSGIYQTRDECKSQVHGYTGAVYKSFTHYDAVLAARKEQSFGHKGQSSVDYLRTVMGTEFEISICTDAACPSNPGPIEWRAVDITTNTELFVRGPYKGGSVNIAEFLAIVGGLQWMIKHNAHNPNTLKTILYTDSKVSLGRVQQGAINTTIKADVSNKRLFDNIYEALQRLNNNPKRSQQLILKKRPTSKRGQIPADFGRK